MSLANVVSLSGAAVGAGSQFLLTLVVARALPPAEAGRFFAAIALFLLLTGVAQAGVGDGVVYFLGSGRSPRRRVILGPALAAAAVAATVLVLLGGPALAAFVPFAVLTELAVAATRARGTMKPTAYVEGGRGLLQVALVATALQAGIGPEVAWGLPWIPACLAACVCARHGSRDDPITGREFWRYTGPRGLAQAVQAAFRRIDILLIAWLAGPAAAAVYTAVTRFRAVGQVVNQALAKAVQPRLVAALSDGDPQRARRLYQASTAWLVLLTWPVWLGVAFLAPELLKIFGPEYASGRPVAVIISVTMLFATACGMVDVVLIAAGRTAQNLRYITTALIVMVGLDLVLIPQFGIVGGALGWSAGLIVKNTLPLIRVIRDLDMPSVPIKRRVAAR